MQVRDPTSNATGTEDALALCMTNNGFRFLLAMMMTALVGCGGTDDEETPGLDAVVVEEEDGTCGADPSCTQAAAEELPATLAPTAVLSVRKSGDDRRRD